MAQSERLTKDEIRRDEFAEAVLKVFEFLKDNIRPILISATVVVVVVGGVSFYRYQQQENRAEAFLSFTQALESYQDVERDWLNPETEAAESKSFETVSTEFQSVFQKHPNAAVADKARFNYAKTLYYQGNYDSAQNQFQTLIDAHQPENHLLALYAHVAIGNCYEQKGEFERALEVYASIDEKVPPIPMREFALADMRLSRARCYEKLGRLDDALATYKDLIDQFRANLESAIQQKSQEFIPKAESLVAALNMPSPVATSTTANSYDNLIAYRNAIHQYKVDKDIHGGLTSEQRTQIARFEKTVDAFLDNLEQARDADAEGRTSTALYSQAVTFDFAPSRSQYEKALFEHDRLRGKL